MRLQSERPKVLFGVKADWNDLIGKTLASSEFDISVAHLDIVDLSSFDAVVPLQLSHYDELRRSTRTAANYLIPSPKLVELCDDKWAFSSFLIANGFGDHVPRLRSRGAPYPYVWKPRRGAWGRGCSIISGVSDEQRIVPSDDHFAQECVETCCEYAVHALCKEGATIYMSAVEYKMPSAIDIKGVNCSPLEMRNMDHPPEFAGPLLRIIKLLEYSGACCFDIKIRNGLPMILELNPRFGGSLCGFLQRFLNSYIDAVN